MSRNTVLKKRRLASYENVNGRGGTVKKRRKGKTCTKKCGLDVPHDARAVRRLLEILGGNRGNKEGMGSPVADRKPR